MSTAHEQRSDATGAEPHQTQSVQGDGLQSTPATMDGWVPEDRPPSAAENNFMSFALFGFLIFFGVSCFVLF